MNLRSKHYSKNLNSKVTILFIFYINYRRIQILGTYRHIAYKNSITVNQIILQYQVHQQILQYNIYFCLILCTHQYDKKNIILRSNNSVTAYLQLYNIHSLLVIALSTYAVSCVFRGNEKGQLPTVVTQRIQQVAHMSTSRVSRHKY